MRLLQVICVLMLVLCVVSAANSAKKDTKKDTKKNVTPQSFKDFVHSVGAKKRGTNHVQAKPAGKKLTKPFANPALKHAAKKESDIPVKKAGAFQFGNDEDDTPSLTFQEDEDDFNTFADANPLKKPTDNKQQIDSNAPFSKPIDVRPPQNDDEEGPPFTFNSPQPLVKPQLDQHKPEQKPVEQKLPQQKPAPQQKVPESSSEKTLGSHKVDTTSKDNTGKKLFGDNDDDGDQINGAFTPQNNFPVNNNGFNGGQQQGGFGGNSGGIQFGGQDDDGQDSPPSLLDNQEGFVGGNQYEPENPNLPLPGQILLDDDDHPGLAGGGDHTPIDFGANNPEITDYDASHGEVNADPQFGNNKYYFYVNPNQAYFFAGPKPTAAFAPLNFQLSRLVPCVQSLYDTNSPLNPASAKAIAEAVLSNIRTTSVINCATFSANPNADINAQLGYEVTVVQADGTALYSTYAARNGGQSLTKNFNDYPEVFTAFLNGNEGFASRISDQSSEYLNTLFKKKPTILTEK